VSLAIDSPEAPARNWRLWLIVAVGALYAILVLRVTLHAQDEAGGMHLVFPLVLALLPIGAAIAFRYPLIFPFVLYVALIPFDALLQVAGGATIARIVGLALAGSLICRMLILRRVLVPPPALLLWAALLLYAALTMLWSPDPAASNQVMSAMLTLFLVMTLLAMYPASPREFAIGIGSIVPCGMATAVYALHQFSHGSISDVDNGRLVLSTASGYSLDPNYFALSFIIPLGIALAGIFYVRNLFVRLVCIVAVPLMMFAVFVTGSRGGAIGALVCLVYFAVRSRYRIQAIALGIVALGGSVFVPAMWDRILNDPGGGSGSGRTYIWATGMHSFGDHWLFGSGVGSYQFNYDLNFLQVYQRVFQGWSRPGHSIFFVSLNDFGVLGLVLVFACWYFTFRQMDIIPKTSWLYGLRLACEGLVLGYFVAAFFFDPFYVKFVWLATTLPFMIRNMYAPRAFGVGARVPGGEAPARGAPAFSLRGF